MINERGEYIPDTGVPVEDGSVRLAKLGVVIDDKPGKKKHKSAQKKS